MNEYELALRIRECQTTIQELEKICLGLEHGDAFNALYAIHHNKKHRDNWLKELHFYFMKELDEQYKQMRAYEKLSQNGFNQ